jgi:cell division protein ZapA
MNEATEAVSIAILDRKYQFACAPEQRKDLLAAAHSLDERMREIKESGRLMSLERIALQAALNLSDELLKIQRDNDLRTERIDSKIRLLADQLDNALKT